VQEEANRHDLNNLTGLGSREGGLEHRFVLLGIKAVANGRFNRGNAMFCQDIRQLAQSQLNPFDQRGSAGAGFVAGGIKRALEVVKDRQKSHCVNTF